MLFDEVSVYTHDGFLKCLLHYASAHDQTQIYLLPGRQLQCPDHGYRDTRQGKVQKCAVGYLKSQ